MSTLQVELSTFQILQTEQQSATPLLRKKNPNKYVSVSFEQVKIMTMHNKSSVNTERISSKSKFVQGHRVTPKNLSKYSIHRSACRSINAVKNP